jgi:hypothetical protein
MLYVLYSFVTYLLTLTRSLHTDEWGVHEWWVGKDLEGRGGCFAESYCTDIRLEKQREVTVHDGNPNTSLGTLPIYQAARHDCYNTTQNKIS